MRGLIQSFKYALQGIGFAIKNERNLRIHLCASIYVLLFSLFYKLTATEYILLILTIILMLFAELTNTAIEYVVDLQSRKYNIYAKIAKDVSAGAVLLCAIGSVIVGVILFFDTPTFNIIISFFLRNVLLLGLLIASFVLSYIFIFKFGRKRIRGAK